MLRSGDVLSDRYRLESPIATGGMGDVWRATDTVLGRVVAVKVLRASLSSDPGFGQRFRAEAQMMAALRHPGIADVYDYGEIAEGDLAYLVMAYVDGEPLSSRIAATGPLAPAETMSIIAQAGRALHAAHGAGIVHRDVKPGNLLIQPDGAVVLVDFGVARSANIASVTGTGEVIGTALYMAPEQVSKQTISPGTDIYALGAVAYHCLAGSPPFSGGSPVEVALRHLDDDPPPLPDHIPADVRTLVASAMAKDPGYRYPTAAAMADAAEAAGRGTGTTVALAGMAGMAGPVGAADTVPVGAGSATAVMPPTTTDLPPDRDAGGPLPPRHRPTGRRTVAVAGAVLLGAAVLAALVALSTRDAPPSGPGDSPPAPATSGPAGVRGSDRAPGTGNSPGTAPPPAPATATPGAGPTATAPPQPQPPPPEPPPPPPVPTTPQAPPATSPVPAVTSQPGSPDSLQGQLNSSQVGASRPG